MLSAMEQTAGDVEDFLQQHPSLQPIQGNKVRCSLTGHELPCRLPELLKYTSGKKYKRLTKTTNCINYSSFEPHIVPSTKNPHQLFCKLTVRHINKIPEEVQQHVQGKRYLKALQKYEECQQQGVKYIPACLQNKNRQKNSGGERPPVQKEAAWEPTASNSEDSDSNDSMSDLYPDHMFSKKGPEEDQNGNIQSDSDDEMEVDSLPRDNKRQQKQKGPTKKKFKTHQQRSKRLKNSAPK